MNSPESHSSWFETVETMPQTSALKKDVDADVCIVGGGIAGLTTAYLLSKEGRKVCVIEDRELASGQTGLTTAQASAVLDHRYLEIEKYHGQKGAKLAAESHLAAMNQIEAIARDEKINCDLERVSGYLFDQLDHPSSLLDRELAAVHRAGLADAALIPCAPIVNFDTGTSIHFPNQIQFHPLKYLRGLAQAILREGGEIYTHTHAIEIKGAMDGHVKTKSGFCVNAKQVVVATHTPVNDIFAIHTKQASYRTYVIALAVPKDSIENALFWDTASPFHYVRLQKNFSSTSDLLLVGGEDHKTGQNSEPKKSYERLEAWARKRFPEAAEVVHQWSGQIMEPVDGLAFLGHNPMDRDNVFVITGDSGNGTTSSTIGAMLITDQIMERENPWETLYHPSRITLRATPTYLKENANTAAQYADWITEKKSGDLSELRRGEGRVYREGMKMIAAYKDPDGDIYALSAVCPHLGGIVRWNSAEKSWDCPCHGSRFDCMGKVLDGPAMTDLKEIADADTLGTPHPARINLDQLEPRFPGL